MALSLFVEYLERYYFLICFAAFLQAGPQPLLLPRAQTPTQRQIEEQGPAQDRTSLGIGRQDQSQDSNKSESAAGKENVGPAEGQLGGSGALASWTSGSTGFRPWMKARPELYSILRR